MEALHTSDCRLVMHWLIYDSLNICVKFCSIKDKCADVTAAIVFPPGRYLPQLLLL